MKITQLCIYPVKSLQGIPMTQSDMHAHGLAWDRRWMLVDAQQRFVTQRQLPALATIEVALTEQALVLKHPRVAPIVIPLQEPEGQLCLVNVWNDECNALAESEEVTHWFVKALGEQARDLRLVRFATKFPRPVAADFLAGDEAHTYFADGYPFLVTTTGSLQALNQALVDQGQQPVPMNRFRPNIVIECDEAWAENSWSTLGNQQFQLALRKPCQRCKITTIDQQTAEIPAPGEPLKTLLALNTYPNLKGAHFGQNATLAQGDGATICVGDEVEAILRAV